MLVQMNERSNWLKEFSNFNILELKETMIMEVTKTASAINQAAINMPPLSMSSLSS